MYLIPIFTFTSRDAESALTHADWVSIYIEIHELNSINFAAQWVVEFFKLFRTQFLFWDNGDNSQCKMSSIDCQVVPFRKCYSRIPIKSKMIALSLTSCWLCNFLLIRHKEKGSATQARRSWAFLWKCWRYRKGGGHALRAFSLSGGILKLRAGAREVPASLNQLTFRI